MNGDDDKLITVKEWEGCEPLYFGIDSPSDVYADEIQSLSLKGIACKLHLGQDSIFVNIPIPGRHMVYNALAGALVGREVGLTLEEIKVGIESLVPVSGRNNLIETSNLLIIDDCYNANPVSTKASLDVLATADSRRVAVLGYMFELGENEKALHYEVGSYAADKKIDLVICIGELSKDTAKGAADTNVLYFATKADFLATAQKCLQKGDTVLVKASHGLHLEAVVEALTK